MAIQENDFPLTGTIVPAPAAALIMQSPDQSYVMQRRDYANGIFYPGHLGLFGGAYLEGEEFYDTAIREVKEETGLNLDGRITYLTKMTLGFEPFGHGPVDRIFYSANLTHGELSEIAVTEGAGFEVVDVCKLLMEELVVPYDAFAIWMHCNVPNNQQGFDQGT